MVQDLTTQSMDLVSFKGGECVEISPLSKGSSMEFELSTEVGGALCVIKEPIIGV